MCPLYVDVNTSEMYFEVHTDSSFKSIVQEEEIYVPEQPKPDLLPDVPTLSVLDSDYVPDYLPIKQESVWDQSVVGHIINQPGAVTQEIKQEMLDTMAQSIAELHSFQLPDQPVCTGIRWMWTENRGCMESHRCRQRVTHVYTYCKTGGANS